MQPTVTEIVQHFRIRSKAFGIINYYNLAICYNMHILKNVFFKKKLTRFSAGLVVEESGD